ncbi:uncharacterized protein LOC135081165 [Ostrinia nubilalis]|uniref:uncharacterized protein LOC135081165 n=1 Tax=Ostrinia nubilalis TaxID=29057 RepID=UPI0030822165
MASLRFEGALQSLSERQEQFIREVLKNRGFVDNRVFFEAAGKAGDNYVAAALRVTVSVDGGDDFKMIAKIAPQNQDLRNTMNTALAFSNEIVIYEQVLPKLRSLQLASGVPESEILKYAKCYGCQSEEPHEVVLLEDLKPLGYVMLDRLAPMSEEAVLLVLKNFAILHSLSFALKTLEPDTYKKFTSRLAHIWSAITGKQEFTDYMGQLENSTLDILGDESYKKHLRGVLTQTDSYVQKCKKSETSKYLVIHQGDAWTNNIMFKLNGQTPSDAIMIDYQMSSETTPAGDILYFMFNCTSHAARSKHYREWLCYYHEHLDKSLSRFGLKAKNVYPKDQLESDMKKYSMQYFGFAVMLYSVLLRNPEEAAKMHEAISNHEVEKMEGMPIQSMSGNTINKFKSKVQDLIDSYIEFGYIS